MDATTPQERFGTHPADLQEVAQEMNARDTQSIIYRVGGPDLTDPRDCAIYLFDPGEPILIDCGSGYGFDRTVEIIRKTGYDPQAITTIILTHCHVDHIGAAHLFRSHFGTKLVMHELDAAITARADQLLTAAFCFEIDFQQLIPDTVLSGEQGVLTFGECELSWLHTPGHTPGSISAYTDIEGERVLFVQDIAAPLLREYQCDAAAWMSSVRKLLALEADILCDGHSGVYSPKRKVTRYLQACVTSQKKQGLLDPEQ